MELKPLTLETWEEFAELFGDRGACGGCWCQWWRISRSDFNRFKGEGNRRRMRQLVERGEIPGLLGFLDQRVVAWCAVAPRNQFPQLDRSRILARVDGQPVWSLACFFIARPFRRRGLSADVIDGACRFAREHGATILEGYPLEPQKSALADAFAWTGLASAFRRAGFIEVARRSPTRPVMRRELK